LAVKGYGDRAFQNGSELSFRKHNVVVNVQGPMAERAARLANDAITAPVVVANCVKPTATGSAPRAQDPQGPPCQSSAERLHG